MSDKTGLQSTGGITGKPLSRLSEGEMVELSKPLIFGNHQRLFKLFSWSVGLGIVYYMVFRHDFGEKEHCFSKIREWKDQKMKDFFYVEPTDREVQQMRQDRTSRNT